MDFLFQKLTENIKNHDKIIIMTHKHPDLDGMSSAICLYEIVKKLKKEVYITIPTIIVNNSLLKGLEYLKNNNIEINFVSDSEIKKLNKDNPLLIILDTQKPELVQFEELLKIKDIFVIDHHINSATHITNTIFEYIDSNKSSIVEIMTEYLKCLKIKINDKIATLMLAGIDIDTHSYSIKTTAKTFDAASFLLKNEASLEIKNDLLKESLEDVLRRHDYMKNSHFIKKGFLICESKKIKNVVDLAILSDDLLRLTGVKVSFAVGTLKDNTIRVSARSTGEINVGKIMEKIGGGGHPTDAAAEIKNKTTKEVIKQIKKIVLEG